MTSIKASLSKGEHVSFVYNGKVRTGEVESLLAAVLVLKLDEGGFKSFTYSKIGQLSTLIA